MINLVISMYKTEKLKKIRVNQGFTIYDMSEILHISPAYYSQIENKKRRLSYDMAVMIANIFNLKPDDIFYDNNIISKNSNKM